MNSLTIIGIAGIAFWLGYRFYSKKIEQLMDVDPLRPTPAITKCDGLDYVPAKHWTILFGHHFASIAGAGPIIGPIVACAIWGWGPALLWIILGTIFIGGVHDFSSLIVSVRQGGSSITNVAEEVISKRAKIIFSSFVWLALILIIAVFVYFCANTFTLEPKIILPSLGLIPVAMLVGYTLYNLRLNQLMVTLLGLGILVALIVFGNYLPIDLGKNSLTIWSIVLLIYCFIASVIPVQILLQPRDYLSCFLLFAGMAFGYIGLIISRPQVHLPVYLIWRGTEGILWPMLFVTIACGAVSGFHSLIASGTTSKQLPNERYARRISYGGMVTEGLVAVLALLAVVCGLSGQKGLASFLTKGGAGPVAAFGNGYGQITASFLGSFGAIFAITMLNSFILTTLDTATRIGRYLTTELFRINNRYLSTLIIIFLGGWLALSGKWNKIWPAFGTANQLVAALALIVVTCWLLSRRKTAGYTLIPSIFMILTTVGALIFQMSQCIRNSDWLLLTINGILICLAIFMFLETISQICRHCKMPRLHKLRLWQSPLKNKAEKGGNGIYSKDE